jgi:uncharacterized protein YaaQ
MKLILAVLRDEVSDVINQALIEAGFRVTRMASTGGFLRRGSTTLMIGVDEDKVSAAIALMRQHCPPVAESAQKHVTLFVLNINHFDQL